MAATPSVKVLKTRTYKGGTKTWTNRYHFSGGTPSDNAHWETLFDNIVDAEKLIYTGSNEIVECIGYAAGSDLPVHSKSYAVTGSAVFTGIIEAPSNDVALLRYDTDQRTSKNHPIYLFSYFHSAGYTSGGAVDTLNTPLKNAIATYGQAWIDGFSDGANTYHRAGPNGAVAQGKLVSTYITHRDFRD